MKTSLLTALLVLTVSAGCSSDQGFKGTAKSSKRVKAVSPGDSADIVDRGANPPRDATLQTKETFTTTAENTGLVDVVWTIDNSGSMNEEAGHVRSNFSRFIEGVSQKTSVKVALISLSGSTDTAVSFPTAYKNQPGFVQVNHNVGSKDPMTVTAQASCKREGGPVSIQNPPKCQGSVDAFYTESLNRITSHKGALYDFFRPDAKRVYVFVTDDNASNVDDKNFLSLLAESDSNARPVVFAFRGIQTDGSGCRVAERGYAYERLAQETGGEVFDICAADWKDNFGKLTEGIIKIASSGYTLTKSSIIQVDSVTIDGVPVEKSMFRLEGSKVIIDKSLLTRTGQKIEISYSYRTH